jgi:hypothetical protein
VNEGVWTIDRAVDVRLGGEMEHTVRLRLCEDLAKCRRVADIRPYESMPRMLEHVGQ